MTRQDLDSFSLGEYYTEEATAVPFRLLARGLSGMIPAPLAYAIAAFLRLRGLLHWPLAPQYASGGPHSGRDVRPEELPPAALTAWAAILPQLDELGFRPLKYAIDEILGPKEHVAAVFLDAPGTTLLTLEWMRQRGASAVEEAVPYEFNSYPDDDPEILTGAVRPQDLALADILQLDFVSVEVHANDLSIRQLYQRHQMRIRGRTLPPRMPEAALREHQRRKERRFQWSLQRGLLRRLSEREVETLRDRAQEAAV